MREPDETRYRAAIEDVRRLTESLTNPPSDSWLENETLVMLALYILFVVGIGIVATVAMLAF